MGIVPINLKQTENHSVYRKVFIILMQVFFMCIAILELYARSENYYEFYENFQMYFDIIEDILLFSVSMTYFIGWNFAYGNYWQKLFDLMLEIDVYFYQNLTVKSLKRFYIETMLMVAMLWIILGFDFYELIDTNLSEPLLASFQYMHFYIGASYSFLVTLLVINILKFFQRRYKSLNECLFRKLNKPETGTTAEIRSIMHIYRKLVIFVEYFNIIFGWFLFNYLNYLIYVIFYWVYFFVFVNTDDINIFFFVTTLYPILVSVC